MLDDRLFVQDTEHVRGVEKQVSEIVAGQDNPLFSYMRRLLTLKHYTGGFTPESLR
jgi:hypothetical protein